MRRYLLALWFLVPFNAAADTDDPHYLRSVQVGRGQETDDAVCIGCSVKVEGTVQGDAVSIGGDIEISGKVAGDAVAVGGSIRLLDGAVLEGEATAIGGKIERSGNVRFSGEEDSLPMFHVPGQRSIGLPGAALLLCSGLVLALLGTVAVRPRRGGQMSDALTRHPVLSVVLGTAAFALWIFLVTMLDAPRPVAVAAWIGAGVGCFLFIWGGAGLAWLAGRMVLRQHRSVAVFAAGGVIWAVFFLVPLAGAFAFLAALALSLGISLTAGLGADADWFSRAILRRKMPAAEPSGP